jgi:hypothetical protein
LRKGSEKTELPKVTAIAEETVLVGKSAGPENTGR